jgi:hypothetical protein
LDAAQSGSYTQQFTNADHRVDNDIADIKSAVTSTQRHFVRQLNEHAKHFNKHTHHPTKRDPQLATIDSIPAQLFAGKTVNPIPVVHLSTSMSNTLELTCAKNFTVTYKESDRVGNASRTIRDRGRFGGRKVVTFNKINT